MKGAAQVAVRGGWKTVVMADGHGVKFAVVNRICGKQAAVYDSLSMGFDGAMKAADSMLAFLTERD